MTYYACESVCIDVIDNGRVVSPVERHDVISAPFNDVVYTPNGVWFYDNKK